uniref:DUF1794 domain-containing protein n=1 Tax=Mesocestoides corti TaxID=53468 RepID=A0A5K3G450_MESCO
MAEGKQHLVNSVFCGSSRIDGRWRDKCWSFLHQNDPFEYEEDIISENIGQPNFAYHSTYFLKKVPKHREAGFLKFHVDGQIQLNLADSLGKQLFGGMSKSVSNCTK